MSSKKVIVVFGATGTQGGSVARAILSDPTASQEFTVRAITRDPSKESATALSKEGAEVIKADLEDKDSLRRALTGAYAVFAVTNFMEGFDHVAETRQGKNVADISKELGVKHLIWSSLPYISKISNGNLTGAVHFDSKAHVDEYIRSLSIPYTILHVATFTTFVLESLAPLSTDPPAYGIFLPQPVTAETAIPLIDARADLGKFVKGVVLNPAKSLGRQFNVAEKYYTFGEIVALFKKLGVNVAFQPVERETFKGGLAAQGAPEIFQEDLTQVVQFVAEYGFFAGGEIEEAKTLVKESLTSLEEAIRSSPVVAGL